jgi:hypothetical protein
MKIYFNAETDKVFNLDTYRLDLLGLKNGNPYVAIDFNKFESQEDEDRLVNYIKNIKDKVDSITILQENEKDVILTQAFKNGAISSFFKTVNSYMGEVLYSLMIEDKLHELSQEQFESEAIIENNPDITEA